MPEIKINTQSLTVADVADVVATPIVQDGATFVREIRIFGDPAAEGNVPVLIIRLEGATAEAVNLTTPELTF